MATTVQALIASTASQYGVDPSLALQVATVESGLNNNAVSSAGAIGIFQLMPATAASLGVNPNDPAQNIAGGVRYLAQMLSRYGGDASKALAAYNWGPGNLDNAIAKYGANWISAIPNETLNYLGAILGSSATPLIAPGTVTVMDPSSSFSTGVSADPSATTTSGLSLTDWLLLGAVGLVVFLAVEDVWS